jgi:hypothetical protein
MPRRETHGLWKFCGLLLAHLLLCVRKSDGDGLGQV